MGMDLGGSSGGPKNEINVTPFVDVVLVLLIIFMVLTPVVLKEIGVIIPRKADEEVTQDIAAQQLVLHIKHKGDLALNGQPIARNALAARLRGLMAQRRERLLFVRVADGVNYGDAVDVLDLCRGAGVRVLGMTTSR
ncbi:MAG: biopolymer transporter ExbD [Deltaproteobacteria bacterium]|nr:biopolymer transporter ExbD [Deltaproteobacteria bacterium]